jgi:hypothetical protein
LPAARPPRPPGQTFGVGPALAKGDSDSGTTPDEYLATVREDAGGDTFRRITEAMTDLTTSPGDDGSVVYRGTVPAGSSPARPAPRGVAAALPPASPAATRTALDPTITADGRHIAFWSAASNIVPGDASGPGLLSARSEPMSGSL